MTNCYSTCFQEYSLEELKEYLNDGYRQIEDRIIKKNERLASCTSIEEANFVSDFFDSAIQYDKDNMRKLEIDIHNKQKEITHKIKENKKSLYKIFWNWLAGLEE